MLLKNELLERIAAGEVTEVYRRWKRPTVKTGGTLNTSVGQLLIEAVDPIPASKLNRIAAQAAGFDTVIALRQSLRDGEDRGLYRVRLSFAGADPRIALRESSDVTEAELDDLRQRFGRMDRAVDDPRLHAVALLGLLATNEAVRAPDLAEGLGVETKWFKLRIRRLKSLGLTESLRVGYLVSPRGLAVLSALR